MASPEKRSELSRYLYWLALALFKLGKVELAVKSLASAQKLEPRGHARAFYCRASNQYGMARAACSEHDDYKAFFSIQVRRYLSAVPGGKFANETEMETILKRIADAWIQLSKTRDVSSFTCEEKLAVYRAVRIDYPDVGRNMPVGKILTADFGVRSKGSDLIRCPCGSGLPYLRCCGRIPSPLEPLRG